MPFLNTDNLSKLIQAKFACLSELLRLGLRQHELIVRQEMTELLRLLGEKQTSIQLLQQIEKQLELYRDQDPESRVWDTPAARSQCAEQVEECKRILNQILLLEKENERQMIAQRDQTAEQLKTIHHAGRVRDAYASQATRTPAPHTLGLPASEWASDSQHVSKS